MRSILLWTVVVLLVVLLGVGGWFGLYLITPAPGASQVRVVIPKGAGVRDIKKILGARGVIRDDIRFLLLARCVEQTKRLRAGEFQVPLGLTPLEVLRYLETAKPVQYRVTIPEGWTMEQVADAFARDNWINRDTFLRLCRETTFVHSLGIESATLEGYLFPETYTLVRGEVTEKILIREMVRQFDRVWAELETVPSRSTTLNRHQLVTLASIVEKETARGDERKTIAGVFYNRLGKKMRLQSDPTTIYGLAHFDGNLTHKDLQAETPYNTYVIKGLPPGPICNPGRAALDAVLHPAEVAYYYFVSKNDGSHYFSATLEEHNRAVHRYQKKGN